MIRDVQGAEFNGKQLCILPSAAQYSQCSRAVEKPDPQHFEAEYRVWIRAGSPCLLVSWLRGCMHESQPAAVLRGGAG